MAGMFALGVVAHTSGQPFTTIIDVPPDPGPSTIGSDTQLNLSAGGFIANQFLAGDPSGTSSNIEVNISDGELGTDATAYNSTVNISGGLVGKRLSVYDSTLNISGGEVFTDGNSFLHFSVRAYDSTVNIHGGFVGTKLGIYDSTLNIFGGEVDKSAQANAGATVNISGGFVGSFLDTYAGSTLNITGGEVNVFDTRAATNISGDARVHGFIAWSGSTVNISGGIVGRDWDNHPAKAVQAQFNSTLNISGGDIGTKFVVSAMSTVNLIGTSFVLAGIDLTPGLSPGESVSITDQDVYLEGLLADGSPFSFHIEENLSVLPDAIWTITLVPEPSILCVVAMGLMGILCRDRRYSANSYRHRYPA